MPDGLLDVSSLSSPRFRIDHMAAIEAIRTGVHDRTCTIPTGSVMIILMILVRYRSGRIRSPEPEERTLMVNSGIVFPDAAVAESELHPILEAIRNRRSIGKMTSDAPDRAQICQILEAGTWAPNHHLTEPWRFFVLEGDARAELGRAMGDVAAKRETDPVRQEAMATKAAAKPMRAPCVIAIAVEPAADETVPEIEEIAAGCAGAQNMLLAAHALGLAAIWRSGWITFEPEIRDHFSLSSRARMLGFIYLGYPAMAAPERQRRSIDDVTTWLN